MRDRLASAAHAPSRRAVRLLAGVIVVTVMVAAPDLASARTTVHPKTAAASPATGDWEGSGAGGTKASFEVAAVTGRVHVKGSRKTVPGGYRVVEDFAVDAPITCTNASQPAIPDDVEVIDGPLRVAQNGSFSSGAIRGGAGTALSGRFTGTRFTLRYRYESQTPNQFAGGTEVCDTGTVHITAAPGHRKLLADGIWQGETQTNEPVVFYVAAGGRALEAPPHPPTNGSPQAAFAFGAFTQTCFTGGCSTSSDDICAYESATSLFVAADGVFNDDQWLEGDDPIVAGDFTGTGKATGQFANGPEGCGQTTWTAEAG